MADLRDIGTPIEFPSDPGHEQVFLAPNGLTYIYYSQDDEGNPYKEGHWTLVGQNGPTGPSGRPGPAGTDGRYPTIDPSSGEWIYKWTELNRDGEEVDHQTPSNYPAQGVLRLKGIVGSTDNLPDEEDASMGDCYFVSDGSTAGDLWVIVFHDYKDDQGAPDSSKNQWVNMGQLGLEGPRGLEGVKGERGEPGKAICEVVDVLPTVTWEPGTIYMEKNTNHLFVAIEPQGIQ